LKTLLLVDVRVAQLVAWLGVSVAASFATCFAADPPKYTGPGSCASSSCHGGVAPRSDNSVWQNEYSTWVIKDKHAQAYTVLSNPVATRMAKILELPTSADTAPKCLACHALDVPPADRARTFDLADGVSCESCHGPASNWLGPHTTKGWTHQQSIDAGMYDDRDLIVRSQRCLTCHLGTSEKFVDHQMIAAGHPDLYFELASFSAVMPKHWQEPRDREPKQDAWIEVRALAVGQAVQLSQQLRRVARNVQSPNWPEYSELDCFACHHSLTAAKDSWRQELGYANRRPGNPPWNLSRYVVLRAIVADDRSGAPQLSQETDRLYRLIGATSQDRAQIAAQASAIADIAERLAQRMLSLPFDPAAALRLLKSISGDADYISGQDERAAEQAAMALDSLFVAYTRNGRIDNADAVRDAIHGLFHQLDDPSSYSAPKFAQQMRVVNGLLK
jgi:Cytochrome c554 and c-prime